jgi:hypothetical protein
MDIFDDLLDKINEMLVQKNRRRSFCRIDRLFVKLLSKRTCRTWRKKLY